MKQSNFEVNTQSVAKHVQACQDCLWFYFWLAEKWRDFFSDIDECQYDKGGCSHECVNVDGSFTCTCPDPLKLSDDNLSCRGE